MFINNLYEDKYCFYIVIIIFSLYSKLTISKIINSGINNHSINNRIYNNNIHFISNKNQWYSIKNLIINKILFNGDNSNNSLIKINSNLNNIIIVIFKFPKEFKENNKI